MSGDADPIYVAARATLLDALQALEKHHASIILVGAQAIYLHTGAADEAVAAYTTDGDLALDPRMLGRQPALEAAMRAGGFALKVDQVGIWTGARAVDEKVVTVDLLVPDSLGGGGTRGARLDGHDPKRRARCGESKGVSLTNPRSPSQRLRRGINVVSNLRSQARLPFSCQSATSLPSELRKAGAAPSRRTHTMC